jgi:parallel beta-helix repeat protein
MTLRTITRIIVLPLVLAAPCLYATDYYVDPATGNMANPGTSASPWSTLQAVFAANKTFLPGDRVLLRNGYHGQVIIKGKPAAPGVTIEPQSGHSPGLGTVDFSNASRWTLKGLKISPELGGLATNQNLVDIPGNSPDNTLDGCELYSTSSIAGWTATDWSSRVGTGVDSEAARTVVRNTTITNVAYGVVYSVFAPNSLLSRTTITNFRNDGIRGLSSDSVYEYNLVRNCFDIDSNHDDGFQSWTGGRGSDPVGSKIVSNVVLRGNTFISYTDPAQPFKSRMQGIGCFDGFFENWVIENNTVITDMYQGIALYGATNCRIVNNTVMKNPINGHTYTPWIRIDNHKDGRLSTGNIIRNNLTRSISLAAGSTSDHNIITSDTAAHFVDFAAFDLRLKPTSPAVNAGSTALAPLVDNEEDPRDSTPDIGADEYVPAGALLYEPNDYAATTTVSGSADSAADFGFTGTSWTSTNDIVAPGLSYSGLSVVGNALKVFSNVGAQRTIDGAQIPADYLASTSPARLGKAGTTLWISFLIRPDVDDTAGTTTAGLNLLGATSGGTLKLAIGDVTAGGVWAAGKGSTFATSSASAVTGTTTFLVVRVAFVSGSGNDEVDLYVNPPVGVNPPAAPTATLRGVDIGSFDKIEAKGNRTSTIDEVTLGTTWQAAVGW